MAGKFTNEEMCEMILIYGECGRRPAEAARRYAQKFPRKIHPHRKYFQRLELALKKHGQFRPIKRPGLQPQFDRQRIIQRFKDNPRTSTREVARQERVSQSLVCNVLKSAHFHPYKIQPVQELNVNDKARRLEYCRWLLNATEENYNFVKNILFSDECIFQSNGLINRHNTHYWATENPHCIVQANSQVRWSVKVWAGILGDHIIGPHFIDGKVDGKRYRKFIKNTLVDLLDEVPLESRVNMWFQQDGHPAHTAKTTRRLLNKKFGNRWIGLHGPREFPPRSPDLTPLDFFLWGYLKQQIYTTRPACAQDLKDRIVRACRAITPQILRRERCSILDRAIFCETVKGGHFEHLLK